MDGGFKILIVMMALMLAGLDWVMYKIWQLRMPWFRELFYTTILVHLAYAFMFLDLLGKI